jgi:putative transposase
MKARIFSQEQIIGMMKGLEAGMPTADVWRKHGISSATFYKGKAKFGGMYVSKALRLKLFEVENVRLKTLLAEATLDNGILKDLNRKKPLTHAARRAAVACLCESFEVSQRWASSA